MDETHNTFIRIATLEHAIEAQLLGAILQEEHIPHEIRSFHDTAYNGLFQFQKGWGSVLAPPGHEKKILEILSSIREGSAGGDAPE